MGYNKGNLIERKQLKMAEKRTCFIITPIGDENSEIRRHIDGVIDSVIIPTMENDYDISVAHRMYKIGSIDREVLERIYRSDLVIANLTGNNPNVMYELALRHALGSPCIIMAEENTNLPFDIKGESTIFYRDDLKSASETKKALKNYLINIDYNDKKTSSPIHYNISTERIISKIANYLEKTTIINKSGSIKLGIKQIYDKPWERPIREEIKTAKEFYSIAYAGDKFIEEHREQFIAAFKKGAIIKILIGTKGSKFCKEVDLMEKIITNEITSLDPKIDTVINEFKRVEKESRENGNRGKIEIRSFNTEFRNAVMIYKDNEGNYTAQLTVMFGYKRASDCMMIEFGEGEGLDDCMEYFNRVWDLHSENVLYDSQDSKTFLVTM